MIETGKMLCLLVPLLLLHPLFAYDDNDPSSSYSLKSPPSLLFAAQSQSQLPSHSPPPFSAVCQSGIREDNTNYIYCARRALYHVPLFSKNNVVYDELVLSDNRIGELTKTSFNRIKVKRIYLNGNPVRFIDEAAFARLENHLEELWLDADSSGRVEPGLPRAIVNYLRNLNRLRLKNFVVPKLENSLFKRLNRIEILSLQFCGIDEIEPNAFDGLMNTLKELYLDGNQLATVPTASLVGLKSLRVLSIAQNAIKVLDQFSFGSASLNSALTGLVRLDLSYNGLRAVDAHSFHIFNRTLDTLSLQNNEINSYSLRFVQNLGVLRELNLDFNLIARLSPDIFANSNSLMVLSMQGNSIHFDEVDEASSILNGLSNLIRFNLARNSIKFIPDGLFKPMRNLKSLYLDKNNMEAGLGEFAFDGLHSTLANLSLQYTHLKSSSLEWLRHFEALERVKLGFNQLTMLDFTRLNRRLFSTLTTLDAQNNRIESIVSDASLPRFDNLVELDLTSNRMCTFDAATLLIDKMPKLRNLGLGQNPLECDCHLKELYAWTRRMFDRDVVNYIQWQCEPVDEGPPRMFTSLTEAEFKCDGRRLSKCSSPSLSRQLESTFSTLISSTPKMVSSSSEVVVGVNSIVDEHKTRISNLNLRTEANSVYVNWDLEAVNDESLIGFKLTYAPSSAIQLNNLSNASTIRKDLAFMLDKTQRHFKIDNLVGLSSGEVRYTVCVSLMRAHGSGSSGGGAIYDNYCRDTEQMAFSTESNGKKQPKIKSVSNQTAHLIMPALEQSGRSLAGIDTSFISSLMITVLVILIACILALIGFIAVYIRRCRITEKSLKKCMAENGAAQSTAAYSASSTLGGGGSGSASGFGPASILNDRTLGSSSRSKVNYTGALLSHTTTTTLAPHTQKLIEIDCVNNAKCFCTLNPSNTNWNGTNARILNCILHSSNGNTIYNPHIHHHAQIPCNCVNLISKVGGTGTGSGGGGGDSSTVSSTVSSSEPTTAQTGVATDMMSLASPGTVGAASSNEETSWRYIISNTKQVNAADLALSTPTSFTHFVLPSQQQHPFMPAPPPYDMYNNSTATLLVANSNSGFRKFMHAPPLPPPPPTIQPSNEHVYCEIPSTLGRSSFRTLAVHHNPLAKNSQREQQQHNQATTTATASAAASNRQNSSTSLLLSSSSATSSTSTSPQSSNNFNNSNNIKFTNAASII